MIGSPIVSIKCMQISIDIHQHARTHVFESYVATATFVLYPYLQSNNCVVSALTFNSSSKPIQFALVVDSSN